MRIPKVIIFNFPTTSTLLALMIVGAVICEAYILSRHPIPEANKELLSSVLGALNTLGLGLILKFYFDSTKAQITRDLAATDAAAALASAEVDRRAPPDGAADPLPEEPPADASKR